MNDYRQKYLEDSRSVTPAFAFGVALMRRIPKKYASKAMALVKMYSKVAEEQVIETYTSHLGLLWVCRASEVPRLLKLVTARSKGDITYSLGEPVPALGLPVRIEFSIPEARDEEV